jgi:hypothetical protein
VQHSERDLAFWIATDLATVSDDAPFAVALVAEAEKSAAVSVNEDFVLGLVRRYASQASRRSDKPKFVCALNGAKRAQMSE